MTAFTAANLAARIQRTPVTSPVRKILRDISDSAVITDADSDVQTAVNVGVAGTGVTAVEYGDGHNHTTVLTIAATDAVTVADNAALADGHLVYTFPAGAIIVNSGYLSAAISVAEDTTNSAAEAALGTVVGAGANATLGAVGATSEDISGPAASITCDGAAEVVTMLATDILIAAAGAHTVFFNIASTWGNTAGTDLTGDLSGTAVINWKFVV